MALSKKGKKNKKIRSGLKRAEKRKVQQAKAQLRQQERVAQGLPATVPKPPKKATTWGGREAPLPPPQLIDRIHEWLRDYRYIKAAHGVRTDNQKRPGHNMMIWKGTSTGLPQLNDIFLQWKEQNPVQAKALHEREGAKTKKEPSSEEDSDDDDSDDDSEDDSEDDSDSDSDDSEDDDSDSESSASSAAAADAEVKTEAPKAVAGTKRKAEEMADTDDDSSDSSDVSSSSDASSDSDSESSDSDSSSDDDEESADEGVAVPPAKSTKAEGSDSSVTVGRTSPVTVTTTTKTTQTKDGKIKQETTVKKQDKTKPAASADSDASSVVSSSSDEDSSAADSSSDASSDSSDDSDDSDASSSSSASDSGSSSSSSSSSAPAKKSKQSTSPPAKRVKTNEGTSLPKTSKESKDSKEATAKRFSRIPENLEVDPRFKSNEYVPHGFAEHSHQSLSVVRGKDFTKEKNKKKRGQGFRGGAIDTTSRAVKFED